MRCYVLAGGGSRRMGVAKAGLFFEGRSFLDRAIAAAREASEVVVVAKEPIACGRRVVIDPPNSPSAAIFGLYTAMIDAGGAEKFWTIAVDMPRLTVGLIAWLMARFAASPAEVMVPVVAGKEQLLCAGYAASLAPSLKRSIDRGQYRLHSLLQEAHVELIAEDQIATSFDPGLFANVNEPRQYERLREGS